MLDDPDVRNANVNDTIRDNPKHTDHTRTEKKTY